MLIKVGRGRISFKKISASPFYFVKKNRFYYTTSCHSKKLSARIYLFFLFFSFFRGKIVVS